MFIVMMLFSHDILLVHTYYRIYTEIPDLSLRYKIFSSILAARLQFSDTEATAIP